MITTYLKLGGILALAALLFGAGFHFGGLRSKAALEDFKATQATNTAKAVLAERAAAATELSRVNAIVEGYENEKLSPVDVGLAHRVLIGACPTNRPVPSAGAHPAAPVSAASEPGSDPEAERLLQAVLDACEADSGELTAIQAAWPH